MDKFYTISIPKPCHEHWNTMTPTEKGRFCDSCAKTVIDFTKMDTSQIQDFIHQNKHNRICGHIRKDQLHAIHLKIPIETFQRQLSFHKLFLLAILVSMGTTLLSCSNTNGKTQKIETVEVIDSISKKVIPFKEICDTISYKKSSTTLKKTVPLPHILGGIGINEFEEGMMEIETVGNLEIIENPPIPIDSIKVIEVDELDAITNSVKDIFFLTPIKLIVPPITQLTGIVITDTLEIKTKTKDEIEETVYDLFTVQSPPEFMNTPSNLTLYEKREYFKERINNFVSENINLRQDDLSVSVKHKIRAFFTINRLGLIEKIRVRTAQPLVEKITISILQKLPKIIPAKYEGKSVNMIYSLPIIIHLKD